MHMQPYSGPYRGGVRPQAWLQQAGAANKGHRQAGRQAGVQQESSNRAAHKRGGRDKRQARKSNKGRRAPAAAAPGGWARRSLEAPNEGPGSHPAAAASGGAAQDQTRPTPAQPPAPAAAWPQGSLRQGGASGNIPWRLLVWATLGWLAGSLGWSKGQDVGAATMEWQGPGKCCECTEGPGAGMAAQGGLSLGQAGPGPDISPNPPLHRASPNPFPAPLP